MALTTMELLKNIKAVINPIVESISEVESIIGFVALLAGILATGGQTIISTCSILSSYNIEIALMTKRERVKMNVTSMLVYIIAVGLFNLLSSYTAITYDTNDGVILGGIILVIAFTVTLIFISVVLLGKWFVKKLSSVHVCRFIGTIFKLLFLKIGTGICVIIEVFAECVEYCGIRLRNGGGLGIFKMGT